MTYRKFSGNPTSYAMTNQIESINLQMIEELQVVENKIINIIAVKFLSAIAAWMCWRNHAATFGQRTMEGKETFSNAMHVSKSMQIQERRTFSFLDHIDYAPGEFNQSLTHENTSCKAFSSALPKICSYKGPVACFKRGATSVQNKRILLRAISSDMLPI